MAEFLT